MYCKHCGQLLPDQAAVCAHCGTPTGAGVNHCANCGTAVAPGAAFCANCGASVAPTQQQYAQPPYGNNPVQPPYAPVQNYPQQKSKIAAGLFGIFLGGLGIHNFYLGYTNKALVQLLVSVVGGIITCGVASFAMGVWGLVEGILILSGSIATDANGLPLKE